MNFDLTIRRVTVQMLVPVHGMSCQRPDKPCGPGCTVTTAEFLVDLDTKECKGLVLDGSVIVDEKFWQWVCARVYEEVRLHLNRGKTFAPAGRIVLDPTRPGFGEWSC